MKVHETAIVHPTAQLAEGVEIGPYSVIGEGVIIGEGTWIGPHVVVDRWSVIGRNCRIYQYASIGTPPQHIKYKGEETYVIIGDNNVIREFVTINRGTSFGGGKTTVGDNNLLMAYAHVAHDCKVGSNTIFANGATLAGHVDLSRTWTGDEWPVPTSTFHSRSSSAGHVSGTTKPTSLPSRCPTFPGTGGASTVRGYRHNSLGPQVSDQDELDYLQYSSDVLLPDNPARGGNRQRIRRGRLRAGRDRPIAG